MNVVKFGERPAHATQRRAKLNIHIKYLEGVETRRRPPKKETQVGKPYGEGIVQTTNGAFRECNGLAARPRQNKSSAR